MRIAIAGGTGTIGRKIVVATRAAGHDSVVLARTAGVDLRTGEGVDAALDGVDAVVDAVSVPTLDARTATAFYEATTATLLRAVSRHRIGHLLTLSIVGVDRNPAGYYAGKLAQERQVVASDAPWTILRATQFHEFAGQVAAQSRLGPIQFAPRARVQPVSAAALAGHLVSLVAVGAQGRAADVTGPREESLVEMIRAQVRRDGRRGPVVALSVPNAQMRGMRAGLNLPGPDALRIGPSFADWLSA
ncbi:MULTISPECIES: SDR family oxidoreductase [Microbacterium]|uniref:SDR family oxidoreductase n=1 Tax=Microbacterium TaxID=33882 RepID=UPI00300F9605